MAPIIRFKISVPASGAVIPRPGSWSSRDYAKYTTAVDVLDAMGIKYVVTTEVIHNDDSESPLSLNL